MFNDTSRKRRRKHPTQPKPSLRFYDLFTLARDEPLSLVPGDSILLHDESFLTIAYFEQEIEELQDRIEVEVYAVGTHFKSFRQCEDLGGFLANDLHEIYIASRKERFHTTLIKRQVKVKKTNTPYPAFRSEDPYNTYVCRYIKTECSVIALPANEADPGRTRLDDSRKRKRFLRRRPRQIRAPQQSRYTFGDAFCGIGGCSAGARKAGFDIAWAFDGCGTTCEVYADNFHNSDVFAAKADEFLVLNKDKLMVDLLHMSPPCQTWSAAHTIPGWNDDANSASLFAVKELLEVARPRIATVEQVPGILSQDNRNFFNAMLRGILETGYSFQWKVLSAELYGVPQLRKRLIIIAACPGQTLPPFPPPTHGLPGLPPLVSLHQSLQNISPNDRLHVITPLPVRRFSTIDFYKPYPGTIIATNNGGETVHPCGTRYFTLREFARIQTFSDSHVFGKTHIKKQIGNAVPPLLAQRIFESCLRTLKETDGVPVEPDVMDLTDFASTP